MFPFGTSKRRTALKWWCSRTTPPRYSAFFDNLGLDAVKAQAGEATIASVQEQEKQAPAAPAPGKTETVKTEQGEVEFEVGGFEDDFNIGPTQQDTAENFTSGREKESNPPGSGKESVRAFLAQQKLFARLNKP